MKFEMNTFFYRCLTLLSLIVLSVTCVAQEDLDEIFSDAKSRDVDQIIKWNIGGLVFADNAIRYEHFFSDFLSLEVGAGLTMGYNGWQFNNEFEESRIDKEDSPTGGHSLSIAMKSYYFKKGPAGIYLSPAYMYRKREFSSQTIQHNYYILNIGLQYDLSDRVFLDYAFGGGYRSSKTDGPLPLLHSTAGKNGNIAATATLQIGYGF